MHALPSLGFFFSCTSKRSEFRPSSHLINCCACKWLPRSRTSSFIKIPPIKSARVACGWWLKNTKCSCLCVMRFDWNCFSLHTPQHVIPATYTRLDENYNNTLPYRCTTVYDDYVSLKCSRAWHQGDPSHVLLPTDACFNLITWLILQTFKSTERRDWWNNWAIRACVKKPAFRSSSLGSDHQKTILHHYSG